MTAGLTEDSVAACFAEGFESVKIEQGDGPPSAWYTFVRV
jgi:hypothetical protein